MRRSGGDDRSAGSAAHRRSPMLLVVVLVAAVGAAALLAAPRLRAEDPSPGPRRDARTAGPLVAYEQSSVGFGQVTGKPLAFGLPIVLNRGDRSATLDAVSVVDLPPGLRLLESHVNGSGRREALAGTTTWPTTEFTDLRPLVGHEVRPVERGGEQGIELVLVFRADRPGRYAFRALHVDYRIGATRHRTTLANGLAVCATAAPERVATRCAPPDDL